MLEGKVRRTPVPRHQSVPVIVETLPVAMKWMVVPAVGLVFLRLHHLLLIDFLFRILAQFE